MKSLVGCAGIAALVFVVVAPLARAADEPPGKTVLPADLDLVPRDALGVLVLDVKAVWNHPLAKELRKQLGPLANELLDPAEHGLGVKLGEIDRLTVVLFDADNAPGEPLVYLVTTSVPFDRKELRTKMGLDGPEMPAGKRVIHTGQGGMSASFINDRTFAVGETQILASALRSEGDPDGPLTPALRLAAEKHVAVGGLNLKPIAAKVRSEAERDVPVEIGLLRPLVRAKHAKFTLDIEPTIRLVGQAPFADADEAREAELALMGDIAVTLELLRRVERSIGDNAEDAPLRTILADVRTSVRRAMVEQKGSDLRVEATLNLGAAKGLPAIAASVQRLRAAAVRAQSSNNLKQIGIAMHNHHDAMLKCPAAAIYGKDGKPLLSWRVALLPYIEEDALYKQFHLDEPWDSPHNKQLLEKMPATYRHPMQKAGPAFETHYLVFTGKDTPFVGTLGPRIPATFQDGTSNTLMVVEAAKGVPWTKPEDLPYDAKKPLPKLGGMFPGGFHALMWDASVIFVSDKVSEKTLRAAITPAGGEVLGHDWPDGKR